VSDDVELDDTAARKALEHALAHKIVDDINARITDPGRLLTGETEALYRTMTTSVLKIMRQAFVFDRDQSISEHSVPTRAFCQSRIDLIDRILEERGR